VEGRRKKKSPNLKERSGIYIKNAFITEQKFAVNHSREWIVKISRCFLLFSPL